MRITRLLAPVVVAVAMAVPQQARAVNTPVVSFVVDCANPNGASTGSLGLELPSGRYFVTVAGACTFATNTTHSYPVGTCVSPVHTLPCVSTGTAVHNVPGATCTIGVGGVYHHTCGPQGVWLPLCGWWYTVQVDGQCLELQQQAGFVNHPGGPMTARVVDGPYADNVGQFVVTAFWTPL